jgi:hypothetical protein
MDESPDPLRMGNIWWVGGLNESRARAGMAMGRELFLIVMPNNGENSLVDERREVSEYEDPRNEVKIGTEIGGSSNSSWSVLVKCTIQGKFFKF